MDIGYIDLMSFVLWIMGSGVLSFKFKMHEYDKFDGESWVICTIFDVKNVSWMIENCLETLDMSMLTLTI